MPLAKDQKAAEQGKPSGTTKGETTNQQPKTTTTDAATAGKPSGAAPATTSGEGPGTSDSGTEIRGGNLVEKDTGDNAVVNKGAARGPTPSNRVRPDAEFDKAKQPEARERKDTFDPTANPGHHVMQGGKGGKYLGTYETEADAQAFIDGHLKDQNIKAEIIKGHDAGPGTDGSTSSPNADENNADR